MATKWNFHGSNFRGSSNARRGELGEGGERGIKLFSTRHVIGRSRRNASSWRRKTKSNETEKRRSWFLKHTGGQIEFPLSAVQQKGVDRAAPLFGGRSDCLWWQNHFCANYNQIIFVATPSASVRWSVCPRAERLRLFCQSVPRASAGHGGPPPVQSSSPSTWTSTSGQEKLILRPSTHEEGRSNHRYFFGPSSIHP